MSDIVGQDDRFVLRVSEDGAVYVDEDQVRRIFREEVQRQTDLARGGIYHDKCGCKYYNGVLVHFCDPHKRRADGGEIVC